MVTLITDIPHYQRLYQTAQVFRYFGLDINDGLFIRSLLSLTLVYTILN